MRKINIRMCLPVLVLVALLMVGGCGTNPAADSFRVVGFCPASCISECYPFDAGDCVDRCILYKETGKASALGPSLKYFAVVHNYLSAEDGADLNPAIGNIKVEKVVAVYKIQDSSVSLPKSTRLSTLEVDAGDTGFIQVELLGAEQLAALYGNASRLPRFPFDVDISYTVYATYAGSDYRDTGGFTITLTGF